MAKSRINRGTLSLIQKAIFSASSLVLAHFQPSLAQSPPASTGDWAHFGFLYDRSPQTLTTGEQTEMLGPLLGWEESGSRSLFRLSPLFSLYRDTNIPQVEAEIGYPILSFDRFGQEYRFQLFQLISFSGGKSLQGPETSRVTLFPFYFHQRSPAATNNYTAFLPFYGQINGRLFRDEIFFVLFPLYVQTTKRGVVTDNYVLPLFHLRQGAGVSGWQFWPLIGHETKEVTSRTNQWGDVQVVGGHEKQFVLWPFYFHNVLGLGTTNQQRQFVLIPFYTSQVSPERTSRSYGFPLGFTHTVDRTKKYEEWGAPWPLVVVARGEGKQGNRVWPLFSHMQTATHRTEFYAWPLYKYNRVTSSPLDRERTRIMLFLYSDLIERNMTRETGFRRRDLWPLFTWRKDHEGNTRFQTLSLLEPILPNNKSIERVYSPVWSLYRYEKNATTGDSSRSFLWNLFRCEHRGESRKHSALFGLFQHEKRADQTRWRILFIPFGSGRTKD